MAYSVNRFSTRAQCAAYLAQKLPERAAMLARLATIQVQLDAWDAHGDPETALADTLSSIATMTPLAAAMSEGIAKRKIENMISDLKKRANNLTGRAETHGPDDLLDREQDRDEAAGDLTVLDSLLAAVQTRHDELPA
jgi:hypothetical protein